VVSVGDWAKELCGGTHVTRSGQLGLVKLLSESSIGAGVRRVEALVGVDAFKFLAREHLILNSLTELIKGAQPQELPERISNLLQAVKEMEREIRTYRQANGAKELESVKPKVIGKVQVITHKFSIELAGDDLRTLALNTRDKILNSVVILSSIQDGRVVLAVAVDEKSRELGIKAGELAKIASSILGGGGGGKDDFAQGGGPNRDKLDIAFQEIIESLNR
jgi:alanyl-tRNA synthetase